MFKLKKFSKLIIVTFSALFISPLCQADAVLNNTDTQLLIASDTEREYKIFTAWPSHPAPKEGWPVIYILDANIMFATMVEAARMMENRNKQDGSLIVGIGYNNNKERKKERALDLTPRLGSTPNAMVGTGGAEDFLRFIKDDLKPHINKRFKINQQQESIFGHSFGGLFVLYSLIKKPSLFDTYIAASPSIWFENKLLTLPSLRGQLSTQLQSTPRTLITVGEYEQKDDPDFPHPSIKRLKAAKLVDNAREYAHWLDEQPSINSKFALITGENHGSVIPAAISRAVRFIFSKKTITP
ncbi:alpha/beta hydrolase [Leucothrix arctica]|nr:alpha/beta hydrolase-fold protein [Leucothrix arctica]